MALIAHWPFNEGSGSTVAEVVGGKDGAISSPGYWDTDPSEGDIYFLDTGTKITVPVFDLSGLSEVSFEWRMMIPNNVNSNGYFFLLTPGNIRIRWILNGLAGDEQVLISGTNHVLGEATGYVGTWFTCLLTINFTLGEIKWYTDGVLDVSTTTLKTQIDPGGGTALLVESNGPKQCFVSWMKVYDSTTFGSKISGNVSGHVSSGVTIDLSGDSTDSTVTDGSGDYEFDEMDDGNYTITPSLAGYYFLPDDRDVVVSGADETGIDFSSIALNRVIPDQTGNNHDAIASEQTSNLLIDPGKIDKAHHYEKSSNQYAELPVYGIFNDDFSISFWARFHSLTQYDFILSFQSEKALEVTFYTGTNNLCVGANQAGVWNGSALQYTVSSGVWYLFVIIYTRSSGWELYVNNSLEDSDPNTDLIEDRANQSYLACQTPTHEHCDMDIDDLRIFDNALSSSDRDFIWNGGSGREDPLPFS